MLRISFALFRTGLIMFFFFFSVAGAVKAQVFEKFGFEVDTYKEGGKTHIIYNPEWTIRKNRKSVKLRWVLKDKRPGTMSCDISGDFLKKHRIYGGSGAYYVGIPAADFENFGEHRFTVTCTDADDNTESSTATLTVEKGYEIFDFYVDSAFLPVRAGSDVTFRWDMSPADLQCAVSGPPHYWPGFPYPTKISGRKRISTTDLDATLAGFPEYGLNIPSDPGEYEYRLECSEPGGVHKEAEQKIKVNVVAASTEADHPVFDALWLSSTRITTAQNTTLNWSVQNADSCTASGNWSGGQGTNGEMVLTGLASGKYDYTLTCENTSGESARTVTLEVTDLTPAQITRFAFNGSRKNEQGKETIQAGETASLRWAVSHAASCEVSGTGWFGPQPLTTAGIALVDAVINTAGEHSFTLTCQSAEGGASDSQTLSLTVLPGDEIIKFEVDMAASVLEPNGKLTLIWETQPTDLTCAVRTNNADWPEKEAGLIEFTLPLVYGQYPYELRCGDKPVTKILVVPLEDTTPVATNLTGQYFGRHTQVMALGDQPPGSFIEPDVGFGIANILRMDGSGKHYNVLGENLNEAYWLWNFDKKEIQLGGGNLGAMDMFLPPYRLYAPDRMRRENADGSIGQFYPDVDPPLNEHIGTFEEQGDGLYAVKFNLQIFFPLANYPLTKVELLMRIGENPDGSLHITTLDEHPDGVTLFDKINEYLPVKERIPVADGIPGVLLPSGLDVYPEGHPHAGEYLVSAGFPGRISPWFFSERMVKVEPAIAKNGIPETIMRVMRLDPALDDQDGDGIFDNKEIGNNWVLPKQTSLDGIYDLLKPREFDGKPHFVGQISLGNGERVVLFKEDLTGVPFFKAENYAPVAFWRELSSHWLTGGADFHPYFYTAGGDSPRLPAVNTNGETLHYDLGMLWVYSHNEKTGFAPFNIYFASGVPPGLMLFDVRERWGTGKSNSSMRRASFAEVPWTPVLDAAGNHDGKTIRVISIPEHVDTKGLYNARLALAHSQENRVPVFNPEDPSYVALLDAAKNYTYTPPSADLQPSIASFTPSVTAMALGKSVRLHWHVIQADACILAYEGNSVSVPLTGNYAVTPNSLGSHTYELVCTKDIDEDHYEVRRTTSVQVLTEAEIGNNHAAELVGVWVGDHRATMYGCPGACVAGQEAILGQGIRNARWIWDFNAQTVQIAGTTLTVGFNYEVQAPGNQGEGEVRLSAPFTNNGDGTYTVDHGFQIYNPGVGNPRADTNTTFRVTVDTENPDRIDIVTIDGDGDGIRGNQIVGIFPMTIQPVFDGMAVRDTTSTAGDGILDSVKLALGLNPDAINGDTDGDGISDKMELGPDMNNPIDSDGDGIIDALEPGEAAHDAKTAAGFALLGGIPGRTEEGLPLSGTTARASVAGDWRFTGVDTGLLELTTPNDAAGAIPDVSMGDVGLKYQYGFVQVKLRSEQLEPVLPHGAAALFAAGGEFAPMAAPVAAPLTFTLSYQAALPPADTLLLYATERVDGRERYTKMDQGWRRVDDYTLEITVTDNSPRDMDDENGYVRIGIAPAAPGVVVPEEVHYVEPLGDVRMFVEFYAGAAQGQGESGELVAAG